MALTLREMYETYIQTNHTIQESTKRRCQRAFGPFVALKGNAEADQVSRADVVAYQALCHPLTGGCGLKPLKHR